MHKVAKYKRTKTLSARRICHNILNVWQKCEQLPTTLFVRVNTGVTNNVGMENARPKSDTGNPETDTH